MVDDPNNPNNQNDPNNPPQSEPIPGADQMPPEQQPPPTPQTPGVDTASDGPRMETDSYVGFDEDDDSEVLHSTRGASVSINTNKRALVVIALIAGVIYAGFLLFGGEDAPPELIAEGSTPTNPVSGGTIAPPTSVPQAISQPAPPVLDVPTAVAPPPPPPPPPPPAPPSPAKQVELQQPKTQIQNEGNKEDNGSANLVPPPPPPPAAPAIPKISPLKSFKSADPKRRERLQASMIVLSGGQTNAETQEEQDILRSENARELLASDDPNTRFQRSVLQISSAERAGATQIENLGTTIVQGKLVEAVLETAINTDLPGVLRAIISRDVYAEAGRQVLIPKGSRLIGQYNTSVFRGQQRVFVVWTRLIRPDGIDIAIGSSATDTLGRAGLPGLVDNKFSEAFSAAILTSVLSIGVAFAADSVVDDSGSTTTNTDGSSTSSGSAGATAARGAVTTIGDVARSAFEGLSDLRPTITVDQGTRINVFVNRDLIFSTVTNGNGTVSVFQ